ncbi:hypothetical protein [Flavobacterium crassostreae]|uniref:Lipoprotein n=1 Tax=Flavobacterium crassostreae TaxID=1763534 RepID=A0A1B9E0M6_9FLAO|nr:hypothetical protein [Flavobacterium crassostreae]OCB75495.1 hypothetical protein LPBF_07780 [Flavobacterium crassostreae]
MKKVLALLVFALFVNSCDDGDLIQEDISFEDIKTTLSCSNNNILYKLKDKEALLLEVPKAIFTNEDAKETTTILPISGSNRVVYRFYNGNLATNTICETIPPATPNVIDQWDGTNGSIVITKAATITVNETENSSRITGYNHNIVFKNITFTKTSGGKQVYENFNFGDYKTTATPLGFKFDPTKPLHKCSTSNIIYAFNTSEAFILDIDPTLIKNEVTAINTPRVGIIGTTQNKLTYRLFSDLVTETYFCNANTPSIPAVKQEWNALPGTTNQNGIIEVTTTTYGANSYKHTIVIKKATLGRDNYSFSLGDRYAYGVLYTSK